MFLRKGCNNKCKYDEYVLALYIHLNINSLFLTTYEK